MVSKNNVTDVLNNRIRATDAIIKCPSYLLGREAIPVISTGLLDLEVYILNLRRQVSSIN
jgi:hypothetical protein